MKPIAIYYLKHVLPPVVDIGRAFGYAIGLHGSVDRDLDLIAAPWTAEAKPAEELVEAIRAALDGTITPDGMPAGRWDAEMGRFVAAEVRNPERKPHGRLAWNIHFSGGAFIDISVMPRIAVVADGQQ